MRWVFLPGLDGTGLLLEPVLKHVPSQFSSTLVRYPTDLKGTYDHYFRLAAEVVARAGEENVLLLAESFSGPVAIRLASAFPSNVKAVILAASFVSHPVPRWWGALLRFSHLIPGHAKGFSWLIRCFLTGFDSPETLVKTVQRIAATVPASVLLHRLGLVLNVNEKASFGSLRMPVLALVARRDRLIPKRYLRQLQATRPDLDFQIFDTSHLLLEREPNEALTCIADFLAAKLLGYGANGQLPSGGLPDGKL
jgi:pimeloyl-[acyl-carrier protein] methyl ester esterase